MQLPSGQVVQLSFFFDRSANLRKLVQNVLARENPASPVQRSRDLGPPA